jgi:hypothetical protein
VRVEGPGLGVSATVDVLVHMTVWASTHAYLRHKGVGCGQSYVMVCHGAPTVLWGQVPPSVRAVQTQGSLTIREAAGGW